MPITKERIEERIEELKLELEQRRIEHEQQEAQINCCMGAIQALQSLLTEQEKI